MPVRPAHQEAAASLALSAGLVLVGLGLAAWLIYERRHREPDLSPDDSAHFARQDLRRALVAAILGVLAIGIFVGSRIPHAAGGRVNPYFLQIWLVVAVLVVVLPVLATADWLATRTYARRHFRALAKERLDLLRDELRARGPGAPGGNGAPGSLGEHPGP